MVKPSCIGVLSATFFDRRTCYHDVLFHQCWFSLNLTKSYKQANVLPKVYQCLLALHQYSFLFFFLLFDHIPLSNSYVVNGANVGNAVLKFDLEGNYLGEVGFPFFFSRKSWLAKKLIIVFFFKFLISVFIVSRMVQLPCGHSGGGCRAGSGSTSSTTGHYFYHGRQGGKWLRSKKEAYRQQKLTANK